MDASKLSASDARAKIIELAERYSFETVLNELVVRLSGDDARDFVEHFHDSVLNN